ncbi:MAG: RING finger domain-containing protein [Candidatus Thorarchaeota archaeon]
MPSCIVCHLEVDEISQSYFECENGHPIHYHCLADWLLHSKSCPLCNELYSQFILSKFKRYIEEKEKEKREALEEDLRKEAMKKMEKVTNNIIFLKFIEAIESLIEDKNYSDAIDLLIESYNETAFNDQNLKILFLLGKANYLRGRYDLAINFLFKLVKLKFDYPDGFLFLGKSYEALGMKDKAEWAYQRISH